MILIVEVIGPPLRPPFAYAQSVAHASAFEPATGA
jgi:hypothetical protein